MSSNDLLNSGSGTDLIVDFSEADQIDLHHVAGIISETVTWSNDNGSWFVTGEVAGAEFSIKVEGSFTPNADDFLWA
jgi:hypothetical protein